MRLNKEFKALYGLIKKCVSSYEEHKAKALERKRANLIKLQEEVKLQKLMTSIQEQKTKRLKLIEKRMGLNQQRIRSIENIFGIDFTRWFEINPKRYDEK